MNIETRDELDTHLDDARQALDKAETLLAAAARGEANDWTIFGRIASANHDVRRAIDLLPTVHSLQASA